ncbi:hypothetical protein F4781DRAFT_143908 [Annulohypoxylon bovei var. microspora]|nr:hypothetical protein F4781DRAFT_143908 [Annulohypoxylon bovei var. microspora]
MNYPMLHGMLAHLCLYAVYMCISNTTGEIYTQSRSNVFQTKPSLARGYINEPVEINNERTITKILLDYAPKTLPMCKEPSRAPNTIYSTAEGYSCQ